MDDRDALTEKSFSRKLHHSTYSPALSLTVLVLCLVGLVAYLLNTMRWVDHTNHVIERALYANKLLLDLQSATRGYYLTGDVAMLRRYLDARNDLPEALRTLRELVNDNPTQSAKADAIMADAHAWTNWVEQTIKSSAPRAGLRPSTNNVLVDKHSFDHVVNDLSTLLDNEYAMRDQRTRQTASAARTSLAIGALLTVLVALIQCRGVRKRAVAISSAYRMVLRQAKDRRQRVEELVRDLDRELQAVGEIQRSLLPIELPTIPGLEIAASYQTSRRAGGDYYDFFLLPPTSPHDDRERFGILIADVSGHGTPAAVLMAVTHSIAHSFQQPDRPPSDLLTFVNRRLCEGYTSNNFAFVTAFYAIYDPANRTLTYSTAGHNPPRLRKRGENRLEPLDRAQGLPLGVLCEAEYTSATLKLDAGDALALYTDGIIEARSGKGDFLNVEGLDAALLSAPSNANAMLHAALDAVHDLAGDAVHDDRTLLILRAVDEARQPLDDAPRQALVVESAATDPVLVARGQNRGDT